MREIENKDLVAGMVTAAPVRTQTGQLIIEAKTMLNEQLISRIQFYNIRFVLIKDDAQANPPAPDPAPAKAPAEPDPQTYKRKSQTYSQAVKERPEFLHFQVDFALQLNELKTYFNNLLDGNYTDPRPLIEHTASLIKHGQTSIEFFDMIHNLRSDDDSIYTHCLNVALISRMIGKWLKITPEELNTLTLAGLLHDIGKTRIPNEILNKQEKLTDEEFQLMRTHPQLGYDILKPFPFSPHVKKAALTHHERCDGSGYPSHLASDALDNHAMVVAIADVYDAMTAARTYRAPLCPFQVIGEFEKDGLQKYNPKFILTFLKKIAATYQSNRVLLSDGRAANIVMLNQNRLSKPLVQLESGECIDLSRSDIYINSIV